MKAVLNVNLHAIIPGFISAARTRLLGGKHKPYLAITLLVCRTDISSVSIAERQGLPIKKSETRMTAGVLKQDPNT